MSFNSSAETPSFSLSASKPNTTSKQSTTEPNSSYTTSFPISSYSFPATLPTPTLELNHLSPQLERDKKISFLSNTNSPIDHLCIPPAYSTPNKPCSDAVQVECHRPYNSDGLNSFSSGHDFEDIGNISNLDVVNFTFGGSVPAEPSPVFPVKVPNNTPVDSLAVADLESFALQDINAETLAALLENGPLYDEQQDPSNWESLFKEEQSSPVSQTIPPTSTTNLSLNSTSSTSSTPLVSSFPFDMKFVIEKSTDIIFGTSDTDSGNNKRRLSEDDCLEDSLLTPPGSVSKQLSSIHVEDPSDRRAVKRARNTMAARRSRDRKRREVDELKLKVADQEKMITQLLAEVNLLRSMNALPPRA